jgi:hypothetical protein
MKKNIKTFIKKNKDRILTRSEESHHRLLFLLVGIDEKNFNFFEKIRIQCTPIPDKLTMIDTPLKKSIQNTIKRNIGFKYDNQTRSYLKKQSYIFNKIKFYFNRFYKSKFILIKEIKFQNKHIKNLRGCI